LAAGIVVEAVTTFYWIGPLIGGGLAAWAQHGPLIERVLSLPVGERGGPAPEEDRREPSA
jgi:hypothetical protein